MTDHMLNQADDFFPPEFGCNLLRSINSKLEFGKHKGKTVQQVMKDDPNWLHWALQNVKDFKLNRNALLLLPPYKKQIHVWDNLESDKIDEW